MADEITLTLEPPYIGSAYSPQVTVEEIEGGHSVTITSDVPGEGIVPTTFDVMDGDASQAIEDAEAAAAAARAAASSASSATSAASAAAGEASTAAGAATDAASAATGAATSASAAAAEATGAARLADDATAAATAAASNAGTATREAIAATTAANNAAATANAAAGSAAIAAADATTAAGTATDAAASATSAASAAGTAADAANTAAEAADEAREGIQEDLAAKADKTGTYSTLTAGGTTPDSVTDAMLVQTGGVLEKVGSIFAEADLPVSVRSIAGATAYEGYNGFISSGAGIGLNTLTSGMDSYVVIATEDMDIWFDGITASYVAITYGSDYTSTYAFDGYYIVRCSSPTRLRSSDGNLPTAESKLHIAAGSAVCFTIRQGQSQTVYGFVTGTIVRESFANEVLSYAPQPESQKRMLVQKYVSSARTDLYVYVPASDGYVLYDLRLVENASINAHIWHMAQAVHVPDSLNLNQSVALTTSGEWEIAIHLQGRDDFSGGSAHGDQMLVGDPIFMVDGVVMTFADLLSTPTECDEIILLQTSNMYDPADHETVIAIEACQHKWTHDGLEVRQSLLWQGDYTLTSSYLAMFPPAKTQTDHAYLDSDMTARAVADVYGEHENAQWACVYGASNGVRMEFWVDEYPNASGEIFLMTDNNGGAYNKCYFYAAKGSQTNPPQVTSGTLWKSVTRYRIEVGA